MVNETFNGWSNYETWNVALWIQNDYFFYSLACDCDTYEDFKWNLSMCPNDYGESLTSTKDGVYFDDPRLDVAELTAMIWELSE